MTLQLDAARGTIRGARQCVCSVYTAAPITVCRQSHSRALLGGGVMLGLQNRVVTLFVAPLAPEVTSCQRRNPRRAAAVLARLWTPHTAGRWQPHLCRHRTAAADAQQASILRLQQPAISMMAGALHTRHALQAGLAERCSSQPAPQHAAVHRQNALWSSPRQHSARSGEPPIQITFIH